MVADLGFPDIAVRKMIGVRARLKLEKVSLTDKTHEVGNGDAVDVKRPRPIHDVAVPTATDVDLGLLRRHARRALSELHRLNAELSEERTGDLIIGLTPKVCCTYGLQRLLHLALLVFRYRTQRSVIEQSRHIALRHDAERS
jgi:hypothetical protein